MCTQVRHLIRMSTENDLGRDCGLNRRRMLAIELSDLAGFRNVLVHIYWDINLDEIYSILQNDLKTLRSFRDEIKEVLRNDG